jgi:hypothetical protein
MLQYGGNRDVDRAACQPLVRTFSNVDATPAGSWTENTEVTLAMGFAPCAMPPRTGCPRRPAATRVAFRQQDSMRSTTVMTVVEAGPSIPVNENTRLAMPGVDSSGAGNLSERYSGCTSQAR